MSLYKGLLGGRGEGGTRACRVAGLRDAQNVLARPHLLTRRMNPIKDDVARLGRENRGIPRRHRVLLLLACLAADCDLPKFAIFSRLRQKSRTASAAVKNDCFWCQPSRPSSRITAPRIANTIADRANSCRQREISTLLFSR